MTVTRNGMVLQTKKVRVKRKEVSMDTPTIIYSFASFDDLISFCKYAKLKLMEFKIFADKNTSLYEYKKEYYIVFRNIVLDASLVKKFCSAVAEFGTYIVHSDLFESKLAEYGEKVLNKNVIGTIAKKF